MPLRASAESDVHSRVVVGVGHPHHLGQVPDLGRVVLRVRLVGAPPAGVREQEIHPLGHPHRAAGVVREAFQHVGAVGERDVAGDAHSKGEFQGQVRRSCEGADLGDLVGPEEEEDR